jgi:hypothetical protein
VNSSDLVAMEAPMVTTREGESIVPAFDWHKRTVDATHALVLHTEALHSMVGLENAASKFAPITSSVCTLPAVHAPLEGKAWVSTGASNETEFSTVPTISATVTEKHTPSRKPRGELQRTRLTADHDRVRHGLELKAVVAVGSARPRLSPKIARGVCPWQATLAAASRVTTGASNE